MVSIVIPCFNQAEFLDDSIKSALTQTHLKTEVIVVNDGSTDHTLSVALKYPITLVNQENKGLSAARNAGIRQAKGEHIICLDADDKLEPNYVEECLKKMKDDTGFVRTGLRHFGDENSVLPPSQYANLEGFLVNNQAYPPSMFKKTIWEEIGGFDEQMKSGYEDWDYFLRIVAKGYKVETINEPLFLYRKHGKSMVDKSREKDAELREYIKTKYLCNHS